MITTDKRNEQLEEVLRRGRRELAQKREAESIEAIARQEEITRHNAKWFGAVMKLIPDALQPYMEPPANDEAIDKDFFWQRIYIPGLAPIQIRVEKAAHYGEFSMVYYLVAGNVEDTNGWSFNAYSLRIDDLAEALAIAEERYNAASKKSKRAADSFRD